MAFAVGDDAVAELLADGLDGVLGLGDDLALLGRDDHVDEADGDAGARGLGEAEGLELVEEAHGDVVAGEEVAPPDEVAEEGLVDGAVDEPDGVGPDFVEEDAADGRLDHAVLGVAELGLAAEVGVAEADARMGLDGAVVEREADLVRGAEERQALLRAHVEAVLAAHPVDVRLGGEVVDAQRDVLRRGHDRLAGGRREDRVAREHEQAGFELRLDGEGHVDGHLVAVEVRVERGAHHRVEADGLALDEHGLERLDREAVQRGRAVEHDRLALGDLVEDVPDHGVVPLDELLRAAHGVRGAALLEAADDERLEEHERHLLGQAALPELQVRPADDDGAAGVVDALAEEVLAEAARLALEHVAEGLEGAPAGAGDGAAVAAVVEDRVDGLLEHALLVADDDVGRLELLEVAQAVVAVDDAAVEVVQVRRGEAAAFEGDERAQLGRDDGHDREDHVLGPAAADAEALADLHALGDLLARLLGLGGLDLLLEALHERVEVDAREDLADALGAHDGLEGVAVLLEVVLVLGLGQELVGLERRVAGIGHEIVLVVDHAVEGAGRHVQQQADAARGALEEPDVRDGHGQLDVAHAVSAHAGDGHFDAAAVADDALVLDALVLAAGAFPVARGPEDLLAEEAVALGAVGAVVDRLRIADFAVAPGADDVGRSQRDADGVVLVGIALLVEDFLGNEWIQSVPPVFSFWPSPCARRRG